MYNNCSICNMPPTERIIKNIQLGVQYMVLCPNCPNETQPPITSPTQERTQELWNTQNAEE